MSDIFEKLGITEPKCKESTAYFLRMLKEKIKVDGTTFFNGVELVEDIEALCRDCHVDVELLVTALNEHKRFKYLAHWSDLKNLLYGEADSGNFSLVDIDGIVTETRSGMPYDKAKIQNLIFKWYLGRKSNLFEDRQLDPFDFNGVCIHHLSLDQCIQILKNKHDMTLTQEIFERILFLAQQTEKLFILNVKSEKHFQEIKEDFLLHRNETLAGILSKIVKTVDRNDFTECSKIFAKQLAEEAEVIQRVITLNATGELDVTGLSRRAYHLLRIFCCEKADDKLKKKIGCGLDETVDICDADTLHYFTMKQWKTIHAPALRELGILTHDIAIQWCHKCWQSYKELQAMPTRNQPPMLIFESAKRTSIWRAKFADTCDVSFQEDHFGQYMGKIKQQKKMIETLINSLLSIAADFQHWLAH
jgi:hypothetical protein